MLDVDELHLKDKSMDELEQFLRYPFEFVPDVHEKIEMLGFEGNAIIMDSLIPLYEKAIQATYEKIKEIHVKGGTHLHLHNMATTFIKIIQGLKEKSLLFFQDTIILQALSKDLIERCDKIRALFLPIHDIWRSQATHYEKRLLIKPYWFDFENNWCTLNQFRCSFVETYNQVYELASQEYLSRKQSPEAIREKEEVELDHE